MKKSLSAPNLPQLLAAKGNGKSKVNTKLDVRSKALPMTMPMIPISDLLSNAVSAESAYHVSFKVAHECALQYPEFVFDSGPIINTTDQEGLALCLATPDDTIVPRDERNLETEVLETFKNPRLRRKTKSANFLC